MGTQSTHTSSRKQSFRTAPPLKVPSAEFVDAIINELLRWGPVRDFPWRRKSASPFQILVAEMLMTRTRAEAVAEVILGLWHRFPTPNDLALAPLEAVSEIIAPLGLGKRADLLRSCAKEIAKIGYVPRDRESLLRLPGIGGYVADAIRVFAYNEPVIPIDAVIGRVLRRVLGYPSFGPAYADRELWLVAQRFARPDGRAQVVASFLDLGALVCLPRQAKCRECPMQNLCIAHLHHLCGGEGE